MQMIDLRRPDQRDSVLQNPFWLTSALIQFDADGKVLVPGYVPSVQAPVTPYSALVTGGDIAAVSGSPDTLTRTAADFVTAGFLDDDVIDVRGFSGAGATANLDFFTLAASGVPGVAAATLTITAAETTLASDAATETVIIRAPKGIVLFSFPKAGENYVFHDIAIQVVTGLTAATKMVLGLGSIATDLITTGGLMLNSDFDAFSTSAVLVSPQTAGFYHPGTASAWYTAAGLSGMTSPRRIVGAATTVPVVYAMFGAVNAGISVGAVRVHMLISKIPGA
jgi:hypothetical protein